MDRLCPSNDVPVPDIIDSGGSKVNHPSNDVPVPDLHDVIDGDKPNLVMWLSQWLHLMAEPGG